MKKAFIVFNLKSLVPPNGPNLSNIKTQPNNPGSNPTINTTMNFDIPLPTDPLFCPVLSCSVFDYVFRGLSQPMIGTFTIPLGQLMIELIEENKQELG